MWQRVGSPKMTGYDSGIELSEKDPLVDNAKLCDGTTNSQASMQHGWSGTLFKCGPGREVGCHEGLRAAGHAIVVGGYGIPQ